MRSTTGARKSLRKLLDKVRELADLAQQGAYCTQSAVPQSMEEIATLLRGMRGNISSLVTFEVAANEDIRPICEAITRLEEMAEERGAYARGGEMYTQSTMIPFYQELLAELEELGEPLQALVKQENDHDLRWYRQNAKERARERTAEKQRGRRMERKPEDLPEVLRERVRQRTEKEQRGRENQMEEHKTADLSEVLRERARQKYQTYEYELTADGRAGESLLLLALDASNYLHASKSLESDLLSERKAFYLLRFEDPAMVLTDEVFQECQFPYVPSSFPVLTFYDTPVSKLSKLLPELENAYPLTEEFQLPAEDPVLTLRRFQDRLQAQADRRLAETRIDLGGRGDQIKNTTDEISRIRAVTGWMPREIEKGALRVCDLRLLLRDENALEHLLEASRHPESTGVEDTVLQASILRMKELLREPLLAKTRRLGLEAICAEVSRGVFAQSQEAIQLPLSDLMAFGGGADIHPDEVLAAMADYPDLCQVAIEDGVLTAAPAPAYVELAGNQTGMQMQ